MSALALMRVGAGLEVAVSCDLRVAGAGASFGMPEVTVGIPSVIHAALIRTPNGGVTPAAACLGVRRLRLVTLTLCPV